MIITCIKNIYNGINIKHCIFAILSCSCLPCVVRKCKRDCQKNIVIPIIIEEEPVHISVSENNLEEMVEDDNVYHDMKDDSGSGTDDSWSDLGRAIRDRNNDIKNRQPYIL